MYNIDIDGQWEGTFNLHSGRMKNGHVWDVHVTASDVHAGYQGPMLFEANVEQQIGSLENFEFSDSSITLTGAASGLGGNSGSHGIVMNSNSTLGNCYYTDCRFNRITINGAYFAVYLPTINESRGALPALKTVNIFNEIAVSNSVKPLYIWPNSIETVSSKILGGVAVRGTTRSANACSILFAADQELYFNVTDPTGFAMFVRLQTANDYGSEHYQLYFVDASSVQIYKNANGSFAQLGADIAITHVNGDKWTFRATGDTVEILQNDVQVATRTDSDVPGAGYVAFLISGDTTSLDNFGGGEIATSALISTFFADEDPIDEEGLWVQMHAGWRTGSANDRLIFSGCTGDAGLEEIDQTRLGANGPIAIVDGLENDWTV
jgi:hypothetical protein